MMIPIGFFGGAGASSAMDFISTVYGTGSSGTITFDVSSLASTYKHLQLRMVYNYGTSGGFSTIMRFNGDTGANYSDHALIGNGSAASAANDVSSTSINPTSFAVGASGVTTIPYVSIVDILDFANTSKYKTIRAFEGTFNTSTAREVGLVSGSWRSTSAITAINLSINTSFNFSNVSRFSLYGIKG